MTGKVDKKLNLAYKCLYLKDEGIIFLFEKIDVFKEDEIEIRFYDGEIFIGFGNNIAILPEKAIKILMEGRKIYLCSSEYFTYEGLSENYYLEVDDKFLARLEGAISIINSLLLQENKK